MSIEKEEYSLKELQEFSGLHCIPTAQNLAGDFFKYGNENFASDFLAFLLDPSRSKTDAPLREFLNLIGLDDSAELIDVTVNRELTYTGFGRVDIVIRTPEMLLLIENKIYERLRKNQAEDYQKALEEERKKSGLNPDLCKVIVLQLEKNLFSSKHCAEVTYITHEMVVGSFERIGLKLIDNMRTVFLFKEYLTYMYTLFEKFELPEDMKIYDGDCYDKIVKAVTGLKESAEKIREYIKAQVSSMLDDEWTIGTSKVYFKISKKDWGSKCKIHFELFDESEDISLPPKEYSFQLHDGDKRRIAALTPKFTAFFEKEETKVIIDYSSEDAFKKSIDKIQCILKKLIEEFTVEVDTHITKNYK